MLVCSCGVGSVCVYVDKNTREKRENTQGEVGRESGIGSFCQEALIQQDDTGRIAERTR